MNIKSTDPVLVKTDASAPVVPNILRTLLLNSKSPVLFLSIEFEALWYISKSALPAAFPNWAFWLSGMNNPSLNVLRPTASTLDTSSYVSVPAIPTLPVTVRSPDTAALPVTEIPELVVFIFSFP